MFIYSLNIPSHTQQTGADLHRWRHMISYLH